VRRVRNAFSLGKPVAFLGNQGAFVIAKRLRDEGGRRQDRRSRLEAIVKCPAGVLSTSGTRSSPA